MADNAVEHIVRYHEETKHHYDRYANSPGYMDWKNQPNPFRFYEGIPSVNLPLLDQDPTAGHLDLYERKLSAAEFTISNLAGFFELSLALSAWKAMSGGQWSLRINPSSGNLHPTEAHVVIPAMDRLASGIYHYNPFQHALEQRAALPAELWQGLRSHFNSDGFLIALSTIFWRESWKYGERAFRYCNHDVGHALAAISFSANLFGWKATCLNNISDDVLGRLLGYDKTEFPPLEEEHPDILCWIHPSANSDIPATVSEEIAAGLATPPFNGRPNRLSADHVDWEIIYTAARLSRKPETGPARGSYGNRDWHTPTESPLAAAEIIRQRRSATSFDREGRISRDQFMTMLDKTLPREHCAPFDAGLGKALVHLLLFVHNVDGLAAGLYFFFRDISAIDDLKEYCRKDFLWKQVDDDFPLFLLKEENCRRQATMVSCHQEIAGESAFSLGMIAKFKDTIQQAPYRYRHLFWESGMIGQVLYLEAEAHGARGTGIGCFFDDAVHDILGFEDNRYQSLYHFTIGKPVEDPRLTTYPPYHHLNQHKAK